jgi:nitrous oxidase accessory protein
VKSLKQAIALAKDKDTLLILPGIYKEGAMLLTKSLVIIGQNYPVLEGET